MGTDNNYGKLINSSWSNPTIGASDILKYRSAINSIYTNDSGCEISLSRYPLEQEPNYR